MNDSDSKGTFLGLTVILCYLFVNNTWSLKIISAKQMVIKLREGSGKNNPFLNPSIIRNLYLNSKTSIFEVQNYFLFHNKDAYKNDRLVSLWTLFYTKCRDNPI